jgi:hypothetical protein
MDEKIQTSDKISFKGYVVGVYEKDDKKIAKIKYDAGFIEIIINSPDDLHLGDGIKINGKLKIEDISQVF